MNSNLEKAGCLKDVKTMDMVLRNVNFQIVVFLIFSEAIPMCTYNNFFFNK